MFGHRTIETQTALQAIPVPRSAFEAEDTWSLAVAVVGFVNRAVQDAGFRRTELPDEAMQAFLVDFYIAEVQAQGHAAFVKDSDWQDYILVEIRAGLSAIGHEDAAILFDEFVALVGDDPASARHDALAALDRRFGQDIGEGLALAERDWLRALDCLLVLEDDAHAAILEDLPARGARRQQHAKESEPAVPAAAPEDQAPDVTQRGDAIAHACEFVCMVSTPDRVTYANWTERNATVGPEGVRGTSVRFTAHHERRGEVLLFPHYAALFMADDIAPRPPVAMDMVQDHVRQMTGAYLPADLWG